MIFNINSTRGQTRFHTCVARVTCLVRNKRSTKIGAVFYQNLRTTVHNSAQLRCFENGNDDFGVEAFWIGDAARVGYFVPLNGPLNGYPPSIYTIGCLKSVGVRSLHVAILARSPREMSLIDRILPRYILSRIRVSVRPRIFVYAKKSPNQTRPHVGSALRPDKQMNWKQQNRPSWVA